MSDDANDRNDRNDHESSKPGDVTEHITVAEHMSPSEIVDVLDKMNRVASALAGRLILGGVFQQNGVNISAAHPATQSILQCAGGAAAAAINIREGLRQQSGIMMPQFVPPKMGRA